MAAVIGNGASTFGDSWSNGTGVSTVSGTGVSVLGGTTSAGAATALVGGTGTSSFGPMLGFGRALVSPPQGASDAYFYTSLPNIFPVPFPGDAVVAGPPVILNPRVLLEHAIFDRKIRAQRADLLDGRRVFRVEQKFLERMQKDAHGYYISIANVKYYWTASNPVLPSDGFFHEWNPL